MAQFNVVKEKFEFPFKDIEISYYKDAGNLKGTLCDGEFKGYIDYDLAYKFIYEVFNAKNKDIFWLLCQWKYYNTPLFNKEGVIWAGYEGPQFLSCTYTKDSKNYPSAWNNRCTHIVKFNVDLESNSSEGKNGKFWFRIAPTKMILPKATNESYRESYRGFNRDLSNTIRNVLKG